jgi:hypothetical protein
MTPFKKRRRIVVQSLRSTYSPKCNGWTGRGITRREIWFEILLPFVPRCSTKEVKHPTLQPLYNGPTEQSGNSFERAFEVMTTSNGCVRGLPTPFGFIHQSQVTRHACRRGARPHHHPAAPSSPRLVPHLWVPLSKSIENQGERWTENGEWLQLAIGG